MPGGTRAPREPKTECWQPEKPVGWRSPPAASLMQGATSGTGLPGGPIPGSLPGRDDRT